MEKSKLTFGTFCDFLRINLCIKFSQNKLLKVALEKNNEQVQEISEILNEQGSADAHQNMLRELRLDNEVSKIISQGRSPHRNMHEHQKHMTSAIQQESTDFATDENTARVSQKVFDTPDRNMPTTTSREVILNTQTIPESHTQNDDLNVVTEDAPQETVEEENAQNEEFLNFVQSMLDNEEVDTEDIITEIGKVSLNIIFI